MANDTTQTVDVKDAAEIASEKQTSGQVDPMLDKAIAPNLTAKEATAPYNTDKPDPGKVVVFDKSAKIDKALDKTKKEPPVPKKVVKDKPAAKKSAPQKRPRPKRKPLPRSRNSRPNRERPRARVNRKRLYF